MSNKITKYILSLLILILFAVTYSFVYIRYLRAWPIPGMGMMSSLSYFSMKHFASFVLNVLMGTLFGVELLLKNIETNGPWRIDFKRLILLGVPLLFLSIEYFRFVLLNDLAGLGNGYLTVPSIESFFRFMLGYVMITSFTKDLTH